MTVPSSFIIIRLSLGLLLPAVYCGPSFHCHEGFNVSFGGIPMLYIWTERSCNRGDNCMIEDFSLKSNAAELAHVNFTFGGCFPKIVEERLSCVSSTSGSIRNNHITSEEIDKLGAFLDKALVNMLIGVFTEREEHLKRIISFGNGIQDLKEGILNFLNSAGYDGRKIRKALYSYTADFTNMKRLTHLLSLLKVKNEATERLSLAMKSHMRRFSAEMPSSTARVIETVPSLFYPMVKTVLGDADTFFNDISRVFESSWAVPSGKDCSLLPMAYFFIQIIITQVGKIDSRQKFELMRLFEVSSQATKDITSRCSLQYPDNERTERLDHIIKDFFAVLHSEAKCDIGSAECRKRREEGLQQLALDYFETKRKNGPKLDDLTYVAQDFNSVYLPAMRELKKNPLAHRDSMVTFIIERTREKLLVYLNLLMDKGEELKDEYQVTTSCEHYVCSTNLCNSRTIALKNRAAEKGRPKAKEEL